MKLFWHKANTEQMNPSQPDDKFASESHSNDEMTVEESKLDNQYSQYDKNYSDSGFKVKIASTAAKLGKKITTDFLFVYHLLTDSDSPIKPYQRALIIGVLGYFILPIDVIPDYIPGAGLVDDGAALAALIASLEKALDADVIKKYKNKAQEHSEKFFGNK